MNIALRRTLGLRIVRSRLPARGFQRQEDGIMTKPKTGSRAGGGARGLHTAFFKPIGVTLSGGVHLK